MKNTLVKLVSFLALASMCAMAQHGNPPDPAEMVQHQVGFLTKHLSLTTQQQQQAKVTADVPQQLADRFLDIWLKK